MCGIAGFIGTQEEADSAARSLRVLEHRGPDDHGWLSTAGGLTRGRGEPPQGNGALLLHRRLSILDLSESGWQPMSTPGNACSIVFNGEVYNYVELREELQREGILFNSSSDTEVLLQAYARWGARCLNRLVGMFALAILDRRRRMLFLARDFFGIKPLYYTQAGGGFAFASEIKALLDLPGVRRQVDPQRLYEYLRFGRTDDGPNTLLRGIHQLPPGHYLEIPLDHSTASIPEPVRYWTLNVSERLDVSFDEAARTLRELFLDNVRLHLRSDVPVGAALSGGIDSSAIVAAMRAVAPHADLHAFSYIADDPAVSEEQWIDLAGSHAGATIHKVRPGPQDLVDDLDHLVYTQDEPFGSTSIYAQYRVFRLAREAGVKVMLDGQGADEMLAGYRPYLAARVASLVRQGNLVGAFGLLRRAGRLPGTGGVKRLLLQTGTLLFPPGCKALAHRLTGQRLMPEWLDASWFGSRGVTPPSFQSKARRDVLREQLRQTLLTTSLPMLLRYEDRNSMASSIESRVPFLTPRLAEFVLRLPEDYLIGPDGTSKRVFRAAMRGLVPDAILDRRDKIGFATPEQGWLTALRPWVDATLDSDLARSIPALNTAGLRRTWQEVLAGRQPFDFRVWRCVNLIRWAGRFGVSFGA